LQGGSAEAPSMENEVALLSYPSFCRHLERLFNMVDRQGKELMVIQLRLRGSKRNSEEPEDSLGVAAEWIRDRIRCHDLMGTGEGESALLLVLLDVSLDQAREVALRCRDLLAQEGIEAEENVVAYPKDGETAEELIGRIAAPDSEERAR
ncbi:MAG: hypothetical protein ACE5JO_10850, partial [Candidatus Binatia bacterium]